MLRLPRLAVVFLALCSPAFAQVTLEMKYPPGSKSVGETSVKTHQILTLAGMDIETKSTTFSVVTKSIGQRGDDGSLPIQEKVDVLQTEVGLPGGTTLQFDSANPDKKADAPMLEPIMERLRVTFKNPSTIVLDDKNKVKEVKFREGLVESLDPSNKSLFDPEKRKKTAEQARGYLPDEAVKPGDTWERATETDFGGGQVMAFRTKYTYVGTVDQDGTTLDKVTGKVFEVSYSVDQTAPIRVPKSDLKVTESDETVLFDRALGNVQQISRKLRIEGPLTLVINGAELEGKVDLTIEEATKRQK